MKPCYGGVCVCLICKDVKLRFWFSLVTQGATAPFISPWPTKLLVFGEDMQSDQLHVPAFSDIARGQAQNPKHYGFISSRLPQSVFSPKPCRRDHVADASLTILGIHRRNIITFWNFNMLVKRCGFWFELYLTTLDALHRFREVPQGALL